MRHDISIDYSGFLFCVWLGVAGLGLGMVYLPAVVAVPYYIKKCRALAIAVTFTGASIGTLVFESVAKRSLSNYGWEGAVVIEAGILLSCILCGMMFRPLKKAPWNSDQAEAEASTEEQSEAQADNSCLAKFGNTKSTCLKIIEMMGFRFLYDIVFILFAVSNLLVSIVFVVPYELLPKRDEKLGFSVLGLSLSLFVVRVASVVGEVIFGLIGYSKCVNFLILCSKVLVLCGICSLFIVWISDVVQLICYASSVGIFMGT